jgi:hypothetical protein
MNFCWLPPESDRARLRVLRLHVVLGDDLLGVVVHCCPIDESSRNEPVDRLITQQRVSDEVVRLDEPLCLSVFGDVGDTGLDTLPTTRAGDVVAVERNAARRH